MVCRHGVLKITMVTKLSALLVIELQVEVPLSREVLFPRIIPYLEPIAELVIMGA